MKTKHKIFSLLFIAVIFIFYQYVRHVRYLNKLSELGNQITNDYRSFCSNYFDCIPQAKKDLQTMVTWALLTSGESKNDSPYSILEDGYEIKYDSIRRITTIYAYGINGKDDSLSNTFYNADNENSFGQVPIYQRGFLTFLLDYFTDIEADVIVARLENFELSCMTQQQDIENLRSLERQLELYSGAKTLLQTPFESDFRNRLLHFVLGFDKRNPLSSIQENGPIALKYKNAKVEFVCDGGLSEEEKKIFIEEIDKSLFQTDSLPFDYAFIPIYIPKPL